MTNLLVKDSPHRKAYYNAFTNFVFQEWKINNPYPGADFTDDMERGCVLTAASLTVDELRSIMGYPPLVYKANTDFTYDNAESYWRDANTL